MITINVTIKDVARDTGLSIGTISKYLNNIPIQEKNRLKIAESIKRLNYKPNTTARHLRSKSSNTICILIPDIGSYIWGNLCNAILSNMKIHKYSVIIRSYSQTSTYNQDIQFLLSKQIDGVLLFSDHTTPHDFISLILENKLPLICINQKPLQKTDFVSTSHFQSAYDAASYLIHKGHTSIALFGIESYSGHQCIDGFLSACKEHSLNLDQQHTLLFQNTESFLSASSKLKITEILQSVSKPTALLLIDHVTTMHFISKHEITKTYSIISLTDDEIFLALNPPLTVWKPDYLTLGKTITELLIKRISGNYDSYPQTITCNSIFQERESVTDITITQH